MQSNNFTLTCPWDSLKFLLVNLSYIFLWDHPLVLLILHQILHTHESIRPPLLHILWSHVSCIWALANFTRCDLGAWTAKIRINQLIFKHCTTVYLIIQRDVLICHIMYVLCYCHKGLIPLSIGIIQSPCAASCFTKSKHI